MRILIRPVMAFMLCALLVACDSAEERAEKHFQSALALIEEGDFDRAEVEFRNVFELNGQHREARSTYAAMLMEDGQVNRSYSQYLRLVEQFPDDVNALEVLTRVALERQNWDEIRRHSERLAEVAPESDVLQVATIALDYREAIEDEDEARLDQVAADAGALIREQPDALMLRYILVQQAMNNGEPTVALAQLDELIAKQEDRVELHLMKLQLLASLERGEEIETYLRALIVQFPDQQNLLPTLLQFYSGNGRLDDAITYLRGYIDENPDNLEAKNTLIDLVVLDEGPDAALEEIDRLLALGNHEVILKTQRGRIMFEKGDREAAIASVQAVTDGAEASDEINTAKVILARMLATNNNEVGARRLVEEILLADSTNGPALKMQAAWFVQDDRADEAVTLLRTAVDANPDDWEAMMLMADAFNRNGNHELARDFVSLAVEASNNAVVPSLRFAEILISEERYILAEETLVEALRGQPSNLEILSALGRVQLARQDWPRVEQIEDTLRRIGSDEANQIATGLEVARLASQSEVDGALAALEAFSAAEGSVQSVAAVVRSRLAAGDASGALEFAQNALASAPDDLALQIIVASSQLANGLVDEGEATLEAVIAANDQIESAWTTLIRVAFSRGGAEARDAMLDRATEAMPGSINLAWARASIIAAEGDTEGAITIYEDLYERASSSPVIANNLATLLATKRDDPESLERAFTVARRLRGSEVPAFQDTYGWIAFRRGDVDEALTYLENAAEGLPGEPSVQYHLGMAYLAQSRKEEALKYFLIAANLDVTEAQFPEIALAREEADKLEAEGIVAAE